MPLADLIGTKVVSATEHDGWWILRFDNGVELRAESDSGKLFTGGPSYADCIAHGMYSKPKEPQ